MTTQQADPIEIIVPDTALDRARRALATCERKLSEQTTPEGRLYYQLCIRGWRQNIAALEAEQD